MHQKNPKFYGHIAKKHNNFPILLLNDKIHILVWNQFLFPAKTVMMNRINANRPSSYYS